ncbi:helix-turn-helix transcriptional regulator [Solihabitans fulvus]|uniref:Helix-turn-helix transcriptional regulator n=1 Tax=Solihabitans fulvus TaxID=1892852 RepID=A0A5B2XE40_9PSEU|nr:AraC family transcriptional regulator [Solihabitans fulvus]KAA2261319.1 helix-turn-helix transcriptional regulator [Solihabitans fulvus]
MNSYQERPAPGGLSVALDCLWTRTVDEPAASQQRVVPDGCTDLIWSRETGALFVAGPDTAHQLATVRPGTLVGVRFRPGYGPAAFGVPAHALRDLRVPLGELWTPDAVGRLADGLASATDQSTVDDLLLDTMLARLRNTAPDPAVGALVSAAAGPIGVADLADRIGLSERQLHRRSLAAFGYGPKVLHRVLRFHRAVALARSGTPFADVAASTGYADQAHLSREVRALAGVPLGVLVS